MYLKHYTSSPLLNLSVTDSYRFSTCRFDVLGYAQTIAEPVYSALAMETHHLSRFPFELSPTPFAKLLSDSNAMYSLGGPYPYSDSTAAMISSYCRYCNCSNPLTLSYISRSHSNQRPAYTARSEYIGLSRYIQGFSIPKKWTI